MTDVTTQDAIRMAMNGQAGDFKSAIDNMLTQKVRDQIDLKKIAVANSFMSDEEPEEEFEISDEELETEGEEDVDQEVQ